MKIETEKIIEGKVDVILANISLKTSTVIHLDAYLQILELVGSENKELLLKIENLIHESYRSNLKSFK